MWIRLVVLFLLCAGPALAKPNILYIIVDDLGYGDLSCYGAKDLQSPHIDALAARGMRFTHFYANCPVCSPTRASALTGRYPELVGVPGVVRTHAENNWGWLAPDAVTLPQLLKQAGYHTACIGKWHLGLEEPNTPNGRGFDFFHGFLGDMMDDYYKHRRHGQHYMRKNREKIDPVGHATDLFSDWAADYLQEQAKTGQPFFLYLAYNAPHTPIQPPKEWTAKVKAREAGISDQRAKLVALVEHMDEGIGKVLAALKATGQEENTLVVFTSDNGGQVNVGASNGGLRGEKQEMYEGGIRSTTCVAWPGKIQPGSVSDFFAVTMDLYPTLAEVAGLSIDHEIDGQSILPTLVGKPQEAFKRDTYFTRREGGNRYMGQTIWAMRRGPWKLLKNSPFESFELYNLAEDPGEKEDLAKKNPRMYNDLAKAFRKHLQRGGSVPWQKP